MQRRKPLLPLALLAAICLVVHSQTARPAIVATGDVLPDPETTPWYLQTVAYVGKTSYGSLTVDSDSDLYSQSCFIGRESAATGVVTVEGTGSTWWNVLGLYVGYEGSGALNITDGANVRTSLGSGYIGHGAGSIGIVKVDGTGSTWTNDDELNVGYEGTGTLDIMHGAVATNGDGYIGQRSGSTGVVTVDGAGSTWSNNEYLYIGDYGSGTLNITDNGVVTVGKSLYVGYKGNGSLNIADGAAVTVADSAYVAYYPGSTGIIHFGPGGGTLTTRTLWVSLVAGLTGTGTINARGHLGDVDLLFDSTDGSICTFTLDSQPEQNITVNLNLSDPSNVGGLGAGYQDNGSLIVRDGVTVSSEWGCIGFARGSTGIARVEGTGSTWTNSGMLYLGHSGNGRLEITDGGAVSMSYGYIGHWSGSTGEVTVDGAGSTWTNGDDLYVGEHGKGNMEITNSAAVSNGDGYIGSCSHSMGVVTVDGSGSTWTNSGGLCLGYYSPNGSGSGTLSIAGGGAVSASSVSIESQSLLTVDVSNSSMLTVDNGRGTIDNSGTVRIIAGAAPEAGATYAPIAAGTWTGSGWYRAIGGTWDGMDHVFTVSEVEDGTAGAEVVVDLAERQRVLIDDVGTGWSVGASFLAMPTSNSLGFVAVPIGGEILDGLEELLAPSASVLGGWEFAATGGYASGNPAYLSFDVGAGYSRKDLVVWHRDGADWDEYAAMDLTYDGTYASFTVTDFSGYAVTTVPESATFTLLLLGLGAMVVLAGKRRRGGPGGIR